MAFATAPYNAVISKRIRMWYAKICTKEPKKYPSYRAIFSKIPDDLRP
jgi:hypothetical protein